MCRVNKQSIQRIKKITKEIVYWRDGNCSIHYQRVFTKDIKELRATQRVTKVDKKLT